MVYRYSTEELSYIKRLIRKDLTNREIASKIGRSEAGIRNIRYRLRLKKKIKANTKALRNRKERIEAEIVELNQTKTHLSNEIRNLEKRKKHFENLLNQDEESMKRKIEDKLTDLKLEKPELFYISGEEQLAKFVGYFIKWLIS